MYEFINDVKYDALVSFLEYSDLREPEWMGAFQWQCEHGMLEGFEDDYQEQTESFDVFVDKVRSESLLECVAERIPDEKHREWAVERDTLEALGKEGVIFKNEREEALFQLGFVMGLEDAGGVFARCAWESMK